MLKQRGIRAAIICLLVILSSSCFSLLLVNAYNTFSSNKIVNADPPASVTGYDFSMGAISEDKYTKYSISNSTGLINFASSVKNGLTFSSKTVYLTSNVDLSNGEFEGIGGGLGSVGNSNYKYFAGTFEGNGWCIKNLKITGQYQRFTTTSLGNKKNKTNYYHYTGLFINLGSSASIKDLKVENCISGISEIADTTYVNHSYHFRALVCNYNGGGSISNCYVLGSTDGTLSNSLILNGYAAKVEGTNVYGALDKQCPDLSSLGDNISFGSSNSTPWYYHSSYNSGWPIPSVFVNAWSSFKFDTDGESTADVTKYVPSSIADAIANEIDNSTDVVVSATGEDINANVPSGYCLSKWAKSGSTYSYLFTAQFATEQYTITFGDLQHDSGDYVYVQPNLSGTSLTVNYGNKIEVSAVEEEGLGMFLHYKLGSNAQKHYYIGTGYKVKSWGTLNYQSIYNGMTVPDLGVNGASVVIYPTVEYKTYTLTFSDLTNASETGTLTHNVKHGTVINLTKDTNSEKTFSFKDSSGADQTVTYTIDDTDLFEFTNSGWTSGNAVISDSTTITPIVEQTYIYVQFNTTTGSHTATLSSGTNKYIIALANNYSTVIGAGTLSGGTLTYTFAVKGGGSQTVTYTNIPDVHIKTSDGVSKTSDTLVTVTPVLSREYIYVTFGSTTGEATIASTVGEVPLKVLYNSGDYISDGIFDWANSRLIYIVTLEGNTTFAITYEIQANATYTFDKEYAPDEPANVEETIVKPVLIIKEYDLGFGEILEQ